MPGQHVALSQSDESMLTSRGYKIRSKLGEGSYAKVYLTEYHSATNNFHNPQFLACKIIDTKKAPKEFVHKFLPREIDILTKINHPHMIGVHGIYQRRWKHFIFMRYAENGDVLDFVMKNGAITERQARAWFRQIALAVQYLHEMEVAHRDLKCENILITANYNVKIADFGFAREVVDNAGRQVLSDTYCGSLSYAAPEILKGVPYHPKMADIWSCGVILYVMLNKAMPFDDTNVKRLNEQQMSRKWSFRSKVVGSLSDEVQQLIPHMLEPDPNRRWRVEQVINSDWFAMMPKLLILTANEMRALKSAREQRRRTLEQRASIGGSSSVRIIRETQSPLSSAKSNRSERSYR